MRWGYQKFAGGANDWAIGGVAAAGGRIALADVGPVPPRGHAPRARSRARAYTPMAASASTWPA
jgi:hypothetical protein